MTELPTNCPRCGRAMSLPVPDDTEPADIRRIARLVLCGACSQEPITCQCDICRTEATNNEDQH